MKQSVFATIANDIKKDILEKKYATGGLLPSENTLCAKYDVTRTTVRRALALLMQENLITSIPGKGYVINSPNRNRFSMQFDELSCMKAKGVKSKLISVNIIEPDFDLMLKLRLMNKKKIVNIKRLFADNSGAVGFDEKFIIYYTGIPIVEKEIHYMTFPNIFCQQNFGQGTKRRNSFEGRPRRRLCGFSFGSECKGAGSACGTNYDRLRRVCAGLGQRRLPARIF